MADDAGPKLDDYHFENTDSGAALSIPSEAGQIKKGGYIMIKGRPCKVVDVSTSKTGKHGHAKANFVAVDIFNGKKVEDVIPTTHTTQVPIVKREEFTLLDIAEDGFVSLMSDSGEERSDMKLPDFPEDLTPEIKTKFAEGKSLVVTVQSACGIDQIVAVKEDS